MKESTWASVCRPNDNRQKIQHLATSHRYRQHHDAIWAQNKQLHSPTGTHGLPWDGGADDLAHRQAEIVASDAEKIAFFDILTAAQMSAPHAAAVQGVSERSLDDFSTQLILAEFGTDASEV